jgi:hypothetical protein
MMSPMTRTKILTTLVLCVLLIGAILVAQPVQNINPKHHPNLAEAQKLSERAYEKIVDAQRANEYDMDGHAQKAKDLLDQANHQLRLAANWANKNAK